MELLAIALALSASPLWCYIYMELLAVCIHVVIVTWNTLTGSFFCCLRCTCFMGAPHSRKLYFICAVHRTLGAQPLCGGTETIRGTAPFVVVRTETICTRIHRSQIYGFPWHDDNDHDVRTNMWTSLQTIQSNQNWVWSWPSIIPRRYMLYIFFCELCVPGTSGTVGY